MQARRVARELALMVLFQLEGPQGQLPSFVPDTAVLDEHLRGAVHTLVEQAKDRLEQAAQVFEQTQEAIEKAELEHPDNLESGLSVKLQPVPLPTTRAMATRLQDCLQAVEWLWETLKTPHLLGYSKEPEVKDYAHKLIGLTLEHQGQIDEALSQLSEDWKLERMPKMDRLLMRLATAELLWVPEVDAGVTLNEAVELAKLFSTQESYRFINGVLARLAGQSATNTTAPLG